MNRLWMIAVLAFLLAPDCSAEPNPADSEIKLGGFDLRLGMSQAETLETLKVAYAVRFMEPSDGSRTRGRSWSRSYRPAPREQITARSWASSRSRVPRVGRAELTVSPRRLRLEVANTIFDDAGS